LITITVSPNLVYFFLTLGLVIISFPLYYIGKKYSFAIELIIPIYAIIYIICLLPVWYENPRSPKLIKKAALLQANNFSYICNMILIFFFTSHYFISLAGRSVLILSCLNISFRRWLAGDSFLLPVLFNWVTTTCLLEGYSYSIQKFKVDLFIDKEMIRKQEE
jgi:hypothetical protein